MSADMAMANELPPPIPSGEWHLQELKPKHRQIASLLAQGMPRDTIASIIGITPEYVTMLMRQPEMQAAVREMSEVANLQLEAMFTKSVTAIGEVLENGNASDKVKAARLQMEATKRVGSGSGLVQEVVDSNARLTKLAERLLYLQGGNGRLINGEATVISQQSTSSGVSKDE